MSLTPPSRALAIAPFVIGLAAVAGMVHLGTILTFPSRARHDAFSRLSQLPRNAMSDLPVGGIVTLPFRDPAMAAAACMFDLARGPIRVAVAPDDTNLLTIGMHSRHGIAFYGLSLHRGEGRAFTMTLMTEAQKAAATTADTEDEPDGELDVVAPEPEGFVLVETPADAADAGRGALAGVSCGSVAQEPQAPARG